MQRVKERLAPVHRMQCELPQQNTSQRDPDRFQGAHGHGRPRSDAEQPCPQSRGRKAQPASRPEHRALSVQSWPRERFARIRDLDCRHDHGVEDEGTRHGPRAPRLGRQEKM